MFGLCSFPWLLGQKGRVKTITACPTQRPTPTMLLARIVASFASSGHDADSLQVVQELTEGYHSSSFHFILGQRLRGLSSLLLRREASQHK